MSCIFFNQSDQLLTQFYSDILQESFFHQQISYISHYNEQILPNYSTVLKCQQFILLIIERIIKSSGQKQNQIKQIISQQLQSFIKQYSEQQQQSLLILNDQEKQLKIINSLGSVLYNRLEEIKNKYVMDCLALGSVCLIDINWKISKVVSSNARTFISNNQDTNVKIPYIIKVTLILRQNKQQEQIKTINLEINKIQLKQLINQLKNVKNQFN